MARAPRAKVSQSSGQGVSRLSYQRGYALGNRGTGSTGSGVSTKFSNESKSSREYEKQKYPGGINVSFGDTSNPTDLAETKTIFAGKPPSAGNYGKTRKPLALKAEKGSSGWTK
jgi:hypothetical protein